VKKILALAMFLGLASVSQAAFIQCTPNQDTVVNNAVASSAVFTCNTGAIATGSTIQLRLSGTFQENNGPTNQNYSVLFSTSTPSVGGIVIGSISCTASGTADANNQATGACSTTGAASAATTAAFAGPSFQVTINGGAGSNPLPFNASASLFFQVNAPTQSGVPEPTSMVLLGSGFVALGLGARLRRNKKA
jgi:hypothetical protein